MDLLFLEFETVFTAFLVDDPCSLSDRLTAQPRAEAAEGSLQTANLTFNDGLQHLKIRTYFHAGQDYALSLTVVPGFRRAVAALTNLPEIAER